MEALIGWNTKLAAIGKSDAPAFVKQLQKLPIYERFAKNLLQVLPHVATEAECRWLSPPGSRSALTGATCFACNSYLESACVVSTSALLP